MKLNFTRRSSKEHTRSSHSSDNARRLLFISLGWLFWRLHGLLLLFLILYSCWLGCCLFSLLPSHCHLIYKLLVKWVELWGLGQLEVDLDSLCVATLESLGLHASLLNIAILGENLCNSYCCVDASLASTMKLHEGEVVVSQELLGKEDVELERSLTPDEDDIGWFSLDLLLNGGIILLLKSSLLSC